MENFTPKSLEEIAEEGCLPAGEYLATITDANDRVSKNSGVDMIELKLKVFNPEDPAADAVIVYDYVSPAWRGSKFRELMYNTGLGEQYEAGHCDPVALHNKR